MAKLGTVFVELSLDDKIYKQKLSETLTSTEATAKGIETSWKTLGTRSGAVFDAQRRSIENSFTLIKNSASSSANDIIRAEEAKLSRLKALNDQQYGAHVTMTENIKAHWIEVTAVMAGAYAAFSAGKQFIDAALQMERITTSMQAVTSNSTLAAREIQFVREESERLGLVFSDTSMAFSKFTAATRNTSIEGEKTRKVFTAVAEAATALKLSADETHGIFNALQQMMSKGKVQAEELRGQLGERLPGAFKLAAEAMGVSEAELNKMLEDGKVLGSELLPKLADKLHETYGTAATTAAQQGQASINRFNNAVFESKALLGEHFLPVLTQVLNTMTGLWGYLSSPKLAYYFKNFGTFAFGSPEEIAKAKAQLPNLGVSSAKTAAELAVEQQKTAAAKVKEADALAKMKKGKTGSGSAADSYATALRQITDETKSWKDRIAELDPYLTKEDSQILKLNNDIDNQIKKIQDQADKSKKYTVETAGFIAQFEELRAQGIANIEEANYLKGEEEYEKFISGIADWGISENEREANKIIAQEEQEMNTLKKLYWKYLVGRKDGEELFAEGETKIRANAIAAKLDKDTEYNKKRAMLNYEALENIKGMEEEAFSLKMQLIDAEAARRIKDGADAVATGYWVEDKKRDALIDFARKSNSVVNGIKAGWMDLYQKQLTWGQAGYNFTVALYENMGDAFGRSFYDIITGDLDDLSDVWDNFWQSMLTMMTNQLGQMVGQWIMFNNIVGSMVPSFSMGSMGMGMQGMGMMGMQGGGFGSLSNMASMGSGLYSFFGGGADMAASLSALGFGGSASELAALSAGEAAAWGYGGSSLFGGAGMFSGAQSLLSAIPGWGWALGGATLLGGLFGGDVVDTVGDVVSDVGDAVGDVFEDIGDWFANGAAFSGGRVTPFARGGIVDSPTLFKMADGMGLMGEAGPEAVMPLTRGPDGKLGVQASGGAGLVINSLQVFLGNQEFAGSMKVIADGVIVERNKRGVLDTQRVYE